MKKPQTQTFGLTTIQTTLTNAADIETARQSLAFAVGASDVQTVIGRKIRKGSKVEICGKLESFGYQSVCLSDCRLR